ncbi:hypothetical protein SLE2022_291960 [Rubroshorea leprosula]
MDSSSPKISRFASSPIQPSKVFTRLKSILMILAIAREEEKLLTVVEVRIGFFVVIFSKEDQEKTQE